MSFYTSKSSFTLALVPDSGRDTKTGSIDHRIITIFFAFFISVFLVCMFFIIGYHIKLSQENGYRTALSIMQQHLETIERHEASLAVLSEKMSVMQTLDRAFRKYATLAIPDNNMYLAGIGGHLLTDDSIFSGFRDDLHANIRDLLIHIKTLDSKIHLETNSFDEIRTTIEARNDLINNTPSILPTQSLNITSGYGTRRHPTTGRTEFHDAVDFTAPLGTKIFATADGIVVDAAFHSIRGNYVTIKHKYGYSTLYAHLHTILVEVGQQVHKRDVIGTMGKTGRATGVNLHYSITHNNRKVNPLDYF